MVGGAALAGTRRIVEGTGARSVKRVTGTKIPTQAKPASVEQRGSVLHSLTLQRTCSPALSSMVRNSICAALSGITW